MYWKVVFIFSTLVAGLIFTNALPAQFMTGSTGGTSGRVLIHTANIEKGHQHTASCFGFGPPGGQYPFPQPPGQYPYPQPTAAPAATQAPATNATG